MTTDELSSLRVLLVEDNPTHAHLVQRHLKKAGERSVHVEHVERLEQALKRLDQEDIDALLLDLSLSDSPIDETLPKVIAAHGEVPIIVLTSLNDLEFATGAVRQGAQDFLVKTDLSGPLLLRSIHYSIERKRTQDRLESYAAELESSNEQLKGFAHTLAHEVKSPLAVVNGCLDIVREKFDRHLDQETREFVTDAESAVHGLTDMVNDLLEFARAGSGQPPFEDVDLEAVFYHAFVILRPAIRASKVIVTHDPLPVVRGSETQLRQLLVNLIGNAIKYQGPERPKVHVAAQEDEDNWTISVRDNGLGIDPADSERIFEVFVRLHRQDQVRGSGIGLAFCKRIVELHGGRIWVESQPGKGSTFRFTLPRQSQGLRSAKQPDSGQETTS